jgi:hypothetical protein
MRLTKSHVAVAGVGAVLLLGGVGAGGAVAGSLITSRDIAHGAIHTDNIHRQAVTLSKLSPSARKALRGSHGKRGARGHAGTFHRVFGRAVTTMSARPDSGNSANWALDTITRTATVTRQGVVPASNCGPSAVHCWFYTGSVSDKGTFITDSGAASPNAAVPITGVVTGTLKGSDHFEFYSNAHRPNSSLVPQSVTGSTDSTSMWMSLFFPSTVTVTTANQVGWTWTYVAPSTCETWVDAASGETGDITGVDSCH